MRAHPTGVIGPAASVEEALAAILRAVSRGSEEDVPLAEANGRVLARAIVASDDLWPFPRAAMDGVAVRAGDLAGAADGSPVALHVVGTVYSGQVWTAPLEPGTAVDIATGAPMPPGADAVVPRELLAWREDEVLINQPIAQGRHVFPPGEDARRGDVVLSAGTALGSGQMALLAALGRSRVPVVRRPSVAILATGDELVPPTAELRPGQVHESNSYALAAEVEALGATPRRLGIARDATSDLDDKIRDGLRADAFVLCGGVSVGDRDLVREALQRAGVSMVFAGVPMKPGAPVAFGVAGSCPVFALPGTPAAARVAFEVLVRPGLRAMLGHRRLHRPTVLARLTEAIKVTRGRWRYLWARATLGASGVRVIPLVGQGTATLRSASDANALIVVEPGDTDLPAGSMVTVRFLTEDDLLVTRDGQACALAVVGARGAGKTTLIERLIPALRRRGLGVAVVKHHVHLDLSEGEQTDTARATRAGAVETVLAGPGGAVYRHTPGDDPPIEQVLAQVGPADLILVEGYSQSALSKILVRRAGVEADRQSPAGPIVAVVCDAPAVDVSAPAQSFRWDEVEALADFVERRFARS